MAHPTVFVVEDDCLQRKALTSFLEYEGLPVRAFASARNFLENVEPTANGCLISDLWLDNMSAIDLMREMASKGFCIPVIICSGDSSLNVAAEATNHGCHDYLIKPFEPRRLVEAVLVALKHQDEPESYAKWTSELCQKLEMITGQEREVLDGVLRGQPTECIATHLKLEPQKVAFMVLSVMRTMGADSLPELVRRAILAGWTSKPLN
ncbi:MAG: response regulator [Alphaproteobacteria bacterium]|nr:response regulator [Alphaproteobacteria bacterium]